MTTSTSDHTHTEKPAVLDYFSGCEYAMKGTQTTKHTGIIRAADIQTRFG